MVIKDLSEFKKNLKSRQQTWQLLQATIDVSQRWTVDASMSHL